MARTTAAEVGQIIETDLDDTIVEAFIDDANLVVTDILGDDTDLSDDMKASIEKWLAAHFIAATRERQAQSEGVKGASITYQGKTGQGLASTLYGQQVLTLDTTGKMASALYKKKASIYAITSFE